MKKLIILSLLSFAFILQVAEVKAQTTNTTQADSSNIWLRFAKSQNLPYGTREYAMPLDSARKLLQKGKAATATDHLFIQTGTNKGSNRVTLVAGTLTVANTSVTANSKIILQVKTIAGTAGAHHVVSTITAGTSFVIQAQSVTGTLVTTDTSIIDYIIVN